MKGNVITVGIAHAVTNLGVLCATPLASAVVNDVSIQRLLMLTTCLRGQAFVLTFIRVMWVIRAIKGFRGPSGVLWSSLWSL